MKIPSRMICLLFMAGAFQLAAARSGFASQVVLSDPLTAWPLNFGSQTANVMLKDGAVHIVEPGNTSSWELYSAFSFTDMDASVTATTNNASASEAGLIFWSTAESFYVYEISPANQTFALFKFTPAATDQWLTIVPWTKSPLVKSGTGAANTLRVVTKGNAASLFVNGGVLGSLPLQAPAGGGSVGFLGAGSTNQPADFAYANLSVSQ
jgi:hypothetical protein